MVSIKQEVDLVIKKEKKDEDDGRKDPTFFLPEEPMSYQIKEKKKKKKKRKQEDPFKDLERKAQTTTLTDDSPQEIGLDPEVTIKVENIEVELDFQDFTNHTGLMVEGPNDDSQEPAVKIEEENKEAVLLTFESIINHHQGLNESEEQKFVMADPSLICTECHLVFQSTKTLETHQKRMHEAYRSFEHICDDCGMSYDMKNSLIAHIRRKHGPDAKPDDKEEKACEICALVFKGTNRLRMHMRRKHGSFEDSFTFACPDCGLTYEKFSSLLVHKKRKHTRSRKPVVNQWYNCPFCPKIFSRRETYARHIQRKHKASEDTKANKSLLSSINEQTGEFNCKECPLVFSTINSLKLHMRRKHNALVDAFRLKCSKCNLSYDKIESLKRHVRRKHDNFTFCEVCNKHFDTQDAYMSHTHPPTHPKVVKECHICGSIFASQGGLAKHLRCTHKLDSPKVIFCSICNKGFHDKRLLKPHMMKVHLKATYTCMYCKKVFKARESYRRHILLKHPMITPVDTQIQQCDKCSEQFPDESELCQHINLVHGEEKKVLVKVKIEEDATKQSYQCTKCPEVYESFEQLKSHFEEKHYFPPETQCQMCGEILPGSEIKAHIKQMHTVEIQQTCRYCEFKTDSKTSMTQHLLRHKNAETLHCDFPGCKYNSYYEVAMEKHKQKHKELGVKLQCTKCPFQTMNKYILRYHEEAHMTGKKRYQCDQCDYATILPANLVQHKYKHSAEKRFKCEVCPFATKYNTSLRFHVKKKHCDLPTFS